MVEHLKVIKITNSKKKVETREFIVFKQCLKVVAHEGNVKDWAAYVENWYTRDNGNSDRIILSNGYKLKYEDAIKVFPDWDNEFTWRD